MQMVVCIKINGKRKVSFTEKIMQAFNFLSCTNHIGIPNCSSHSETTKTYYFSRQKTNSASHGIQLFKHNILL